MSIYTQLSMSPVEESRKRGRPNGEDYISNLPESVITHILSRLPTKDAVRTSVLSKDWEYKWTSIYNMDIDDRVLFSSSRNDKTTFVDFVERILFLSQNLKRFRLFCRGKYNLRRVTAWISAALRRNVECFELKYYQAGIVLPRSLLNNNSLQKLKLRLPCIFKVPHQNCFPNLINLYLYKVEIVNELSNSDKLIFNFPILECFEMRECKWLNVKSVEIFAPALTSFKTWTPYSAARYDHSIKIFVPRLAKFESLGDFPENIIVTGPPVVKAVLFNDGLTDDLQLLRKSGLQFRKLLKEFSSLKKLELTDWVIKAIALAKEQPALPKYGRLRKLYLSISRNIEALLELLHSAPSLKVLIIQMWILDDYDYDAMESVPSCIMSQLEEVELHNYDGRRLKANLVKFLFKNGVKLKKCRVAVVYNIPRNEIMEQLSSFHKASTCLSIEFKKKIEI